MDTDGLETFKKFEMFRSLQNAPFSLNLRIGNFGKFLAIVFFLLLFLLVNDFHRSFYLQNLQCSASLSLFYQIPADILQKLGHFVSKCLKVDNNGHYFNGGQLI